MAKSANSGKLKQDAIISGFQREIRNEKYRTQLSAVEQAILAGSKMKEMKKPEPKPFISFYNPNNPLNGFHAKSKAEQQEISKMLRAQERAAKKAAKQAKA